MNYRLVLLLTLACISSNICAQVQAEVDRFIKDVKVKTFDCPSDEIIPQLDDYLSSQEITETQRFKLQVEKTHWQICMGNYGDAEATIDLLIANPKALQSEEYYALAVYQKGFLFDIKEDERRCDYYEQAKSLSLNKFDDISLSSELGLMTYCEAEIDDGQKLKRLFDILEHYSMRGDKPTIAHIHNNIGLIYGRLGQHVLAAEQFQKTHEIGFPHYQGANKYASLISVFTSLLASGQYDEAEIVIDELDKAREAVDVPLVHAWYYYAKGRFNLRLGRVEELKKSVNDWRPHLEGMETTIFAGIHHWFEIAVCINERQKECIQQFLLVEENNGPSSLSFLGGNVDYLSLMANAYAVAGDTDKARQYWSAFEDELRATLANYQSSGKVLGVANLYNKILELENSVIREQKNRDRFTVALLAVFAAALLGLALLWRRKQAEARSYDSVTGLLNSRAALTKIRNVSAPSEHKTIALALFDLANFKEVNRLLGSNSADDAIQQIAMTFKNITRDSDIVGRFAPEQFILCLPDIEETSAKTFFERIRVALESTHLGDQKDRKISVSSSMSIYLANAPLDDLDEVLNDMMLSLSMQSEGAK
ncbi:MAG: diguanylate cyclase (GGDEF)-like protein [Glaciecola sp.]